MAKEKEEVIEGGDESGDAFDYKEIQSKVAPKDKDEDDTSVDDLDRKRPEPEDHRIEGGDEDWDEEGADLDEYTGDEKGGREEVKEAKAKKEEVEEEVEEKEEKEEKVEEKELSEEEKQDKKIQEDVIKYLSEEKGGTKYVVKGKEYDMQDLSPQEFRDRFSKAGRFYERMEEISAKEKIINERERLAEDGARRSQEIMHKYGGGEPKDKSPDLPDFFKPDTDDDFETKALKKGYADLYSKVDTLERGQQERDFSVQKQDLYRQLDSLEREFPMMSKSEVIAVKSMPEYAGVDMRLIAENSHNARMSDEYLDAVKKARPDKFRELDEQAVEKHLKKNPNVRKVSRKPSNKIASKKISEKKKQGNWTFDKIEAHMDEIKAGLADLDDD